LSPPTRRAGNTCEATNPLAGFGRLRTDFRPRPANGQSSSRFSAAPATVASRTCRSNRPSQCPNWPTC